MREGISTSTTFVCVIVLVSIITTAGKGPTCLSCQHVIGPRHCHSVITCEDDEVCATNLYLSENGEKLFDIGCYPKQMCPSTSRIQPPSNKKSTHPYLCTQCCSGDLCNSRGCGEIGYPANRGPICFACSQTRNASNCDIISSCSVHEKCHIQEVYEYGETFFTTGCKSKHVCNSYISLGTGFGRRNLKRNIRIGCSTCCTGDLCNSQCSRGNSQTSVPSTTPVTTSITTTTTTTTTTTKRTTQITTGTIPPLVSTPVSTNQTKSHYGTEFILVFPARDIQFDNVEVIITAERNTVVELESPHPGINNTFVVSSATGTSAVLPHSIVLNSSVVEKKGVHVKAQDDIAVYCILHSKVTEEMEGFYAIPIRNLGNSYVTHGNTKYNVALVSIEDFTCINITPGSYGTIQYNSKSYGYDQSFSFCLNKFDSVQLRSDKYVMGTFIKSTRKIGVVNFDEMTGNNGGPRNYLVEYIPSITELGTRFVIPSFDKIDNDLKTSLIFSAMFNQSSPAWKTSDISTTCQHYYCYFQTRNNGSALRTDNQVLLMTYGDKVIPTVKPFMTQIPAVKQFSNNYKIKTPIVDTFDNYISAIFLSSYINDILLDGKTLVATNHTSETVRFERDNYTVINTKITRGQHSVNHSNPNAVFGLIVYGYSKTHGGSYAFPAGLRM